MKYSAQYISEIGRKTGLDAVNLEKVLRLKEVLKEFARHPFLPGKLVLKGGTAINLFLFSLPRLSVDIDLNYVGQVERDGMREERPEVERAVGQVCSGLGYQLQPGVNDHALLEYHLGFTNHAGRRDHVQVEINFLMRVCALPPATREAARLADESQCRFPVLATEELMAGKLKAMIERGHPRDVYDLYQFARARVRHDAELLRKFTVLFASTLNRDLREYKPARYTRIDQTDIQRLLYPLLPANERPNKEEMVDAIMPLLAPVLDYQKEKAYLDAMAVGRYQPDLLFAEFPQIVERLARHPALLWKASNVADYLSRKKTGPRGPE